MRVFAAILLLAIVWAQGAFGCAQQLAEFPNYIEIEVQNADELAARIRELNPEVILVQDNHAQISIRQHLRQGMESGVFARAAVFTYVIESPATDEQHEFFERFNSGQESALGRAPDSIGPHLWAEKDASFAQVIFAARQSLVKVVPGDHPNASFRQPYNRRAPTAEEREQVMFERVAAQVDGGRVMALYGAFHCQYEADLEEDVSSVAKRLANAGHKVLSVSFPKEK